ncbi:MAG TPA: hypothetical protein VES42_27790, partial [Pilimelia sp.]|nr:hypothetical protein [Pilimelia sp.]
VSAPPRPAAAASRDVHRALAFLDAAMDAYTTGDRPRLPQSYADEAGLHRIGYTTDAALAILAYLAHPARGSRQRAAVLGDALLHAQDHDPEYADGRLRRGYPVDTMAPAAGPVVLSARPGLRASGAGDLAWAGIALAALARRTGARRFGAGAARIGAWLVRHCRSAGPLGGFRAGVDADGRPVPHLYTAQNADLVALFGALARLTGDAGWLRQRAHAARFVGRMWSRADDRWLTGSPDGAARGRGPATLDAQTHPWLALPRLRFRPALRYVERRLTVTDNATCPNSTLRGDDSCTGVTFGMASMAADPGRPIEPGLPAPDPCAVWFEGTAQYACAARRDPAGAIRWTAVTATIAAAQARPDARQNIGGRPLPARCGVPAASSPLSTGDGGSGFHPVRHVGATAWFVLAAAGVNPLG